MQLLRPYDVTIKVFDPTKGLDSGDTYVLPVDSPDAEHACASTLANAASFVPKTEAGQAKTVAFCAVEVKARS